MVTVLGAECRVLGAVQSAECWVLCRVQGAECRAECTVQVCIGADLVDRSS